MADAGMVMDELGCEAGSALATDFCLLDSALPGFSLEGEAWGAGPGVGPESNFPAIESLLLLGDVTTGLTSSPTTLGGSLSGSGALLAAQPIASFRRRCRLHLAFLPTSSKKGLTRVLSY